MKTKKTVSEKLQGLMNSKAYMPLVSYPNETLIIFPTESKRIMLFMGIGRIMKITKGENFDLIVVSFGVVPRRVREIVVTNNHARRQLLNLKLGQFAIIYGEGRYYKKPTTTKYTMYWQLYSWVNSALYVPKMFDVRQHQKDVDNGVEREEAVEMDEATKTRVEEVVNDIFNQNFNDMYKDDGDYYDRD